MHSQIWRNGSLSNFRWLRKLILEIKTHSKMQLLRSLRSMLKSIVVSFKIKKTRKKKVKKKRVKKDKVKKDKVKTDKR